MPGCVDVAGRGSRPTHAFSRMRAVNRRCPSASAPPPPTATRAQMPRRVVIIARCRCSTIEVCTPARDHLSAAKREREYRRRLTGLQARLWRCAAPPSRASGRSDTAAAPRRRELRSRLASMDVRAAAFGGRPRLHDHGWPPGASSRFPGSVPGTIAAERGLRRGAGSIHCRRKRREPGSAAAAPRAARRWLAMLAARPGDGDSDRPCTSRARTP